MSNNATHNQEGTDTEQSECDRIRVETPDGDLELVGYPAKHLMLVRHFGDGADPDIHSLWPDEARWLHERLRELFGGAR